MSNIMSPMVNAFKSAGAVLKTIASSAVRRARISPIFAWITLAIIAFACAALVIILPKYSMSPFEFKLVSTASGTARDPWQAAQNVSAETPYKVVLEFFPEHLHTGEEFFLTVHVFWMPDEGEIDWERFVNSLKLPAFVWERDVQEYREVRGNIHYVRRTHTLQAVGPVTFGSTYKIDFEQFAWRKKSSDSFAVEPQYTYMFVVPRYAENATARLEPLAGQIYPLHAWARNALAGISVISVLLAVVYAASALWKLRSKSASVSLDERYMLLRININDSRKTLFALEEIAGAILLEHGENPSELWRGRGPAWQKPVWEHMWPLFAKAYQSQEPSAHDAREAYRLAGVVLKARKSERKKR